MSPPAIKSQGLPITILDRCFSYYLRGSPVVHLCRRKTKIWGGTECSEMETLRGGAPHADPSWAHSDSEWYFCFFVFFYLIAHDGTHKTSRKMTKTCPRKPRPHSRLRGHYETLRLKSAHRSPSAEYLQDELLETQLRMSPGTL